MNIGLVLSGAMAKGAYQIGVLKALNNFISCSEIKYMSCTSIGALNGYAYATENLNYAEQLWENICKSSTKLTVRQIIRSDILQQTIANLCRSEKSLSSAFYCSLFDFTHRNIVYKDLSTLCKNRIPPYLQACVALPGYNHSVRLDNTLYFDGGFIDNIPVYPLLNHDPDYIICVYFDDICYKFENSYFDSKVIKITFPCKSILKESLVFNRDSIGYMIEAGYEKAMYIFNSVFSEGHDNLDYIYRAINYMDKSRQNSVRRITGDVLLTNLNKIALRLTKRKIL